MSDQGISVKNNVLRRMAQTFGFISVPNGIMAIVDCSRRFNGILGPGLHYAPFWLGYKVTTKISLDMQLLECRTCALTKDGAVIFVEGFVQYQIMTKEFDLAQCLKMHRDLFITAICAKVVKMDYASVCKDKKGIGEHVEEFLREVTSVKRIVVVNVEKCDYKKEFGEKWLCGYQNLEPKWTPAIEAFKTSGEKKGKAFRLSKEAKKDGYYMKNKGESKKIQPMDKGRSKKIQPTDEWKSRKDLADG